VVAIGPPIMMKGCADTTRPHGIKTLVSLNPVMVDGTGMCGGCRVKIGETVKFACVDGPDFDGHQVDFDDLMARLGRYKPTEKAALESWQESCRIAAVKATPTESWSPEMNPSRSGRRVPALSGHSTRLVLWQWWRASLPVPARRPGNFHLRPQMKVTKAKALNAKPLSSFFAPCTPGPAGRRTLGPVIEPTVRKRASLRVGPGSSVFAGASLRCPATMSALRDRWSRSFRWPAGPGSAACRTSREVLRQGPLLW